MFVLLAGVPVLPRKGETLTEALARETSFPSDSELRAYAPTSRPAMLVEHKDGQVSPIRGSYAA